MHGQCNGFSCCYSILSLSLLLFSLTSVLIYFCKNVNHMYSGHGPFCFVIRLLRHRPPTFAFASCGHALFLLIFMKN